MNINDTFSITLPQPNSDGIHDCLIQQHHVYVCGGIEHEQAEIRIVKKIKKGYVGKIVKLIHPANCRIQSPCPHINCGGCSYNHMDYASQLHLKQVQIQRLYADMKLTVHPLVGAVHARGYRNKAIFTFQKQKKKIHFGFYQENSHIVEDIRHCLNHDELTNKILQAVRKLVITYHIGIFDEDKGIGILRHVLIRRAMATHQTLVCLVVAKPFKGSQNFVRDLIADIPEITTIVMNINPRKTSAVLSHQEKVLYGKGFIIDELCGHTYQLYADTFYQINHDQTQRLYQKAIDLCHLSKNDIVLDMYCGIGTIGMTLAAQVKKVIGVELNKRSITAARMNAKMNHIQNIIFTAQDASQFMNEYAAHYQRADVVIMDPPRSGSTPEFIHACTSMHPKKILYISCNPVTQHRDLNEFKKYGYQTDQLYPYDLFPNSNHVECIALLTKTKPSVDK